MILILFHIYDEDIDKEITQNFKLYIQVICYQMMLLCISDGEGHSYLTILLMYQIGSIKPHITKEIPLENVKIPFSQ